MRFPIRFAAWLVGVLLAVGTAARHFRVVQLPNQEQLPVANVHRILQDSEGYMWYATEGGGLCRDDGYRVEVFRSDRDRPTLLASNDITCLAEDRAGRIWFGTRKGAYVLDKRDYGIRRLAEPGVAGVPTDALWVAADGAVWLAAQARVFRFEPLPSGSGGAETGADTVGGLRVRRYPSVWKGRPRNVVNFAEDAAGHLWALQADGGLLRYEPDADRLAEQEWPLAVAPNFAVPDRRNGGWWVATWGQGVVRYRPAAPGRPAVVVPQPVTLGPDGAGGFRSQVLGLVADERRRLLWVVAMDDLYAYRMAGDTLVPVDTRPFLSEGKKILDNALCDRRGRLWVPGYSPHTFILQADEPRLRRDSVRPMSVRTGYRVMVDRLVRESDHLFWIWQGRTGLSLYDARQGRLAFAGTEARPAPLSVGKCLLRRQGGAGVWACQGRRLFRVWGRDGEIRWSEERAAAVQEPILSLGDDAAGGLLIGTADAVYRYEEATGVCRRLAAATGAVRAVAAAPGGTVYWVSDKQGLCRLDSLKGRAGRVRPLTAAADAVKGFCALAVAPDGVVWAASSRGNVCRYVPADDRLTEDERAGNPNGDAVKALVADGQGRLWILSDKYLKEYDPQRGAIRLLRCSDAAIDMDYFHTLSLEGDSVCLGGIGAFCLIGPASEEDGAAVPPRVTLLRVDGAKRFTAPSHNRVELPRDVRRVEVFVSTFDPLAADSIRFAFRIRPTDEWTVLPPGDNRVMPDELPGGTWVLEVKATDGHGRWGEPVAVCTFHCPSGWAERAWPWGLGLLVWLAGGVWMLRRRSRRSASVSPSPGAEVLPSPASSVAFPEPDSPSLPAYPTASLGAEPSPSSASSSASPGPEKFLSPAPAAAPSSSPPARVDEAFLQRATEVVMKNLGNAEYSVEQFSGDMCMSRMNLYRKLQALTAQKPSEFIRDIRLEQAAALLRRRELTLVEIADRVGFGTVRYFGKCFKEKYGLSPSQYRQHLVAGGEAPDAGQERM